jgi:hypothetical protein
MARTEVLRRRWSMVSFSRMVMMIEDVVLVGIVAVDSSSKVLLHLQRKMVVRSIDLNGDSGGRRRQAKAGDSEEQSRVEWSIHEEEGKWERVSSGEAQVWG